MQEGERTGRGVDWYGNGEVEDRAIFADRWAAGLRGARGRGEHLGLKLQKLSHEAEVGRDDASALLHELKGLLQLHPVGAHQVCQADGGRARDASLTVNKDTPSFISYRVNKFDGLIKPGADVSFIVVFNRNTLVQIVLLKVVWTVSRNVDESCDP